MRKTVLILLFILTLVADLQAQKIPTLKPFKTLPETELIPTRKRDHWGYVDPRGKIVIKAVFDAAGPFLPVTSGDVTMDVAKINVAGKWGFITKENVYLILPEYDELTEFDEEGNALGSIDGMWSIFGVHPAPSDKGTFQTLEGDVLLMGLTEIGPFNVHGIATALMEEKWGLVDRKGNWVLPAAFDTLEEKDGMFFITRGGKSGVVALDGNILVKPVYDRLVWQADQDRFVACNDGKYGILYSNGKERYPCFFDQVPVESSRGYVETWQGLEPALFMPDDRLYTATEYDDLLFASGPSYASSPILPDWRKNHLDKVNMVTLQSDLNVSDRVDLAGFEEDGDFSKLSEIILKGGRPLGEVLTNYFGSEEPVLPEGLTIYDEGDMLYVEQHLVGDYFGVCAIDLSGRGRGWEGNACGSFSVRKKEKLVADLPGVIGEVTKGFSPTCYEQAGGKHLPVLRYEYHTWDGKPIVYLGHNTDSDDFYFKDRKEGWKIRIIGPTEFRLGDFTHSDNGDYREESFVKIHPAGPDGIAIYEIQQRTLDYSENWENPTRGPKKTVAYGYIGLTRPFFTQALFEGARDFQDGVAEVNLVDGGWELLSADEIKAMDPFVQPTYRVGESARRL